MTERGQSPHEYNITTLLSDIDELADPLLHPELTDTDTLDRLLTLQDFASRLYRSKKEVVIELIEIKRKIIETPDPYPDEAIFREMLIDIYRKNTNQFIGVTSF